MAKRMTITVAALIAAGALATGCDDEAEPGELHVDFGVGTTSTAPSDSQLAQLLLTANMGEVAKAQAARPKLSSAQGQQFADRMVTEHSAAITREQMLYSQLAITPVSSAASDMLLSQTNADLQRLQSTPAGTGFDLTYLCMSIREHAQVLALVDANTPSATNAQLRAEAQRVRTAVADHLQAAEDATLAVGHGTGTNAAGNAGPPKDLPAICAPYGGLGGATVPDGGAGY